MMKVTYLRHSGFLLEMEDIYCLFDYYKGDFPIGTGTRRWQYL